MFDGTSFLGGLILLRRKTPLTRRLLVYFLSGAYTYQLNATLCGDRVLNELTRTPLVLSEITTLFTLAREIPRTKLALLGAVIDLMEQSEAHSSHLQGHPLWGHAGDYLRKLAIHLTARGDVILGEAEARTTCHSVSERLRKTSK